MLPSSGTRQAPTFITQRSQGSQTVPSRVLFDERLFDKVYFKKMMRESRDRKMKKREELRRLFAESRSGALSLLSVI